MKGVASIYLWWRMIHLIASLTVTEVPIEVNTDHLEPDQTN